MAVNVYGWGKGVGSRRDVIRVDSAYVGWRPRAYALGSGIAVVSDALYPRRLHGLEIDHEILQVAYGPSFVAVLTAGGDVYTRGVGEKGQLGHGKDKVELDEFERVDGLAGFYTNNPRVVVVKLAVGAAAVLALSAEGRLYSWGSGASAVLGHGNLRDVFLPKLVAKVDSVVFVDIWIGGKVAYARDKDGGIYAWGHGPRGLLGLASPRQQREGEARVLAPEDQLSLTPLFVPVSLKHPFATMDVGQDHALGVSTQGELLVWGGNGCGQLGSGDTERAYVPTLVPFPPKKVRVTGSAAPPPVIHITPVGDGGGGESEGGEDGEEGEEEGEEGENGEDDENTPIVVLDVAAGSGFSLVVGSNGVVYSVGLNTHGQLGCGEDFAVSHTLSPVDGVEGVIQVEACGLYAAALTESGEVYTWGYGGDGVLGTGLRESAGLPQRVAALAGKHVVHIDAYPSVLSVLVLDDEGDDSHSDREVVSSVVLCRTTVLQ